MDRRLDILFCTLEYFPTSTSGGAERQAKLQAEELVRRGHRVTVVCGRSPGTGDGNIEGVQVRRLWRLQSSGKFRNLSYCARLVPFLARNLPRRDLVHVHLGNLHADVAVAAARLLGKPSYVKVATAGAPGEIAQARHSAPFTRQIGLRGATRVQALSSQIADELAGIGVAGAQVVSLPNGLDVAAFSPADRGERAAARARLDLAAETPLALYAGRFVGWKGVPELISAWCSRDFRPARLVLVGEPNEEVPTGSIPLDRGIVVRPWTNSVVDYLHAADVYVHPTHSDGMSNSLLEAMACGLAPVATRLPASEMLITDGREGLLVPQAEPAALAAAMAKALQDAPLRASLGRAARSRAEDFSIQRVVDRLEDVYAEMLAANGARGRR